MARKTSALTEWTQYLGARLAATALTAVDVDVNLRTAAGLGRLLYAADRRHRQRTWAHLRIAFPHLAGEARDRVARRSFEHFVQLVVEVCHTPRLVGPDSWARRLGLGELGSAIELFTSGRPAIMVTGHLGNWEVLGYLLAVLGLRMEAVARPLDNRLLSDWLYGIRERRGMRIITKWGATERMLAVLEEGGTLGFIADQNAGDRGMFVPFFGRLASTYKSIGLLAIHREVPIVCGYARRLARGFRYELGVADVIEPASWRGQADPLYYVTARYMRAIEAMVAACPEQYLWMHRRWKSRPRFERLGRPMPAALRRNLESLPWMDTETLARIAGGRADTGP